MTPNVREAKLRPEFADLYPGLAPDVWQPAVVIAEHLLARALIQRKSRDELPDRVLNEEHFEFRGGKRIDRAGSPPSRVGE